MAQTATVISVTENLEADTGHLNRRVGYQLRRLAFLSNQLFVRLFSEEAIAPGQFSIFYLISLNTGISQKMLAKVSGVDQSTLVPTLNYFEESGWVSRVRSKPDRRITGLELTSKGKAKIRRLIKLETSHEEMLTMALSSEERELLLRLLGKLRTSVIDTSGGANGGT